MNQYLYFVVSKMNVYGLKNSIKLDKIEKPKLNNNYKIIRNNKNKNYNENKNF